MKKRPYVKVSTDWCDHILLEWAARAHVGSTESAGNRGWATTLHHPIFFSGKHTKKLTARGTESRPPGKSKAPTGFKTVELSGEVAKADLVVRLISGVDARCAWVLRAEYGLIPALVDEESPQVKATHLGMYLDGRAWPASAYLDRLTRAKQMFCVGYLVAVG